MTKRVGLQWRLTIALVVIVLTPLAASYFMIDQISTHAANTYAKEAADNVVAMERALDSYRELFETTKRLHAVIADRIARRPDVLAGNPDLAKILEGEGALEANLRGIAILRADGTAGEHAEHPPADGYRDKVVDQPMSTGGSLRLTFAVRANLQDDYQKLNDEITAARRIADIRADQLPHDYRNAFLVVIALAALAAAALGIILSTLLTRRIDALVQTARRVSEGRHDARVELRGHDEMAELGSAFNTMLDDLAQTRSQVEYLQRIGAWQDVARRLAHEIKNPLTPIQLAVQQTVSAYKGQNTDVARFEKQLRDAKEIVEEEIEGLRRLVDTFRTLGQLPKVEAAPIALAEVIEELRLDPTFAAKLELEAPPAPVTVRADKLLLKRVLANLVENGIHAGAEAGSDGKVIVAWREAADAVTITVDDHGKGVADADRDRIFEPYVTSKATGTGLGLAIARKIAIEHGGDLALAPGKAPTGGARFVVSLPLRGPEASLA